MTDFEELSFSYLGLLSNAHHDGTTQQIDDCCGNFETDQNHGSMICFKRIKEPSRDLVNKKVEDELTPLFSCEPGTRDRLPQNL